MNARPPDGSDEPEAVDQVMLAVLSNRGREGSVLSAEEERLLDGWVDGRLSPAEADRAASLVKRNSLAAERVLERRLLTAAAESPRVPQDLAARVLKPATPPKAARTAGWWRLPRRWQWTGLAGAVALASIVTVFGVSVMQRTMQGDAPLQVAMATIGDRTPLFEASDIRMRGPGAPQPPAADQRFRDIEVPVGVLKGLLASATGAGSAPSREIDPYLPSVAEAGNRPVRVIVDSALRDKVDASDSRDRMSVRLYDLQDPRVADIRNLIAGLPDNTRAYFLTLKP